MKFNRRTKQAIRRMIIQEMKLGGGPTFGEETYDLDLDDPAVMGMDFPLTDLERERARPAYTMSNFHNPPGSELPDFDDYARDFADDERSLDTMMDDEPPLEDSPLNSLVFENRVKRLIRRSIHENLGMLNESPTMTVEDFENIIKKSALASQGNPSVMAAMIYGLVYGKKLELDAKRLYDSLDPRIKTALDGLVAAVKAVPDNLKESLILSIVEIIDDTAKALGGTSSSDKDSRDTSRKDDDPSRDTSS